MARKQLLLELLQQAQNEEDILFEAVTLEEREQIGEVDDWAVKDAVAHFSYWRNLRAAEIGRVVQGGSMRRIDDFDQENARIFEEFREMGWEDVTGFARKSSLAMQDQLALLSESDLELVWRDEQPIWSAVTGNAYSHPLIHISEYYQSKGDMKHAAEITGMLGKPMAGLDEGPIWRGMVHYNVACSYSLMGKKKEAVDELRLALELRPNMIEWSQQDPDLDSLREEPDFLALYENIT